MEPSYIIYFSLIPLAILAIIWIVIRTMEGAFHRYPYHKVAIYAISSGILVTAAIIIIIISFFV